MPRPLHMRCDKPVANRTHGGERATAPVRAGRLEPPSAADRSGSTSARPTRQNYKSVMLRSGIRFARHRPGLRRLGSGRTAGRVVKKSKTAPFLWAGFNRRRRKASWRRRLLRGGRCFCGRQIGLARRAEGDTIRSNCWSPWAAALAAWGLRWRACPTRFPTIALGAGAHPTIASARNMPADYCLSASYMSAINFYSFFVQPR
jgi:hypothetical protein